LSRFAVRTLFPGDEAMIKLNAIGVNLNDPETPATLYRVVSVACGLLFCQPLGENRLVPIQEVDFWELLETL